MNTRHAIRYVRAYGAAAESSRGDAASASPPGLPELEVVHTVREDSHQGRPGLSAALERIAAGDASVLLVPSLRMVAGSLRELVDVVEWLAAVGADLVAEDIGLDTASSSGRATVAVLREVAGWEDAPDPERPRRGRPGLSRVSPELVERIAGLRSDGMTLQAVADQLNAEGTPTPRGGMKWRPSSVQSALGYRRPRPPAAGVPPVPPPGPHAAPPPGPHAAPPPGPHAEPPPGSHAERSGGPHAARPLAGTHPEPPGGPRPARHSAPGPTHGRRR